MELRTSLGSNHQPASHCKYMLETKLSAPRLSASSHSADSILIMVLLPVVFDQLLHLLVHSTEFASHIDKLQRITRNLYRLAGHNDGHVSFQTEQIRRTSDAYERYS